MRSIRPTRCEVFARVGRARHGVNAPALRIANIHRHVPKCLAQFRSPVEMRTLSISSCSAFGLGDPTYRSGRSIASVSASASFKVVVRSLMVKTALLEPTLKPPPKTVRDLAESLPGNY
jgi:hypothetical protein